jgi:hypothetical protein
VGQEEMCVFVEMPFCARKVVKAPLISLGYFASCDATVQQMTIPCIVPDFAGAAIAGAFLWQSEGAPFATRNAEEISGLSRPPGGAQTAFLAGKTKVFEQFL